MGRSHGTKVVSRIPLEKVGVEGDTPVDESNDGLDLSPSTTGHEESGGKLGGPSSKAKYLPATDSA